MSIPDTRVPTGPVRDAWSRHQSQLRLVNPSNKRRLKVLVVGSGLAGAGAAASLAEQGYDVTCLCYQDSARRAHSIAAQGGINAAKNYQNDGDTIDRLFMDTLRGGDYRSREAHVHRLAELSTKVIDHCVAQGVPFAREYGGVLANRSFGGVQVKRTFYARGQTGQQLLLASYCALSRQVGAGRVHMLPRREALDVVVNGGRAEGVIVRNLVSGALERHAAHAVVMATGGYGTIYYLSTLAMGCNATAAWRAHRRGALFANPSFVQIHPTCLMAQGDHQAKLTLMSESLRNDGRIWVPTAKADARAPGSIPEGERDYYLERKYPAYGNLAPRDIASRAAKEVCDQGHGIGPAGRGVYLDFKDAIAREGVEVIRGCYGNLFQLYETITGDDPYTTPMRIYPAAHFTMGGLWVDYHLMTSLRGLYAVGECNFADHGANRLGANSLLQACVDGNFILPYTLGHDLSGEIGTAAPDPDSSAFGAAEFAVRQRISALVNNEGSVTPRTFHRRLGAVLWDRCGISRTEAGLRSALRDVQTLREEFHQEVRVVGRADGMNPELEKALRISDFMELAELMVRDALTRDESCGAHFREEHQSADGEAQRDDDGFKHISAWQHREDAAPVHHAEPLSFTLASPSTRSYK
ncbi:MAG: fumarate reductase/succinate dehydrogenase flavoprotein subunit [Nannocystaceae bacterium]|nr:fumarate reductase/succinate dehydrogenase flavoprotein subunit [Nannocystaceae bacterium]